MKIRFLILICIFASSYADGAGTVLGMDGVQSALLSPDGQHFVIVNRRSSEDFLYIINAADTSVSYQRTLAAPARIASTGWLDSESIFVQLGTSDNTSIEPIISGDFEIINLSGEIRRFGKSHQGAAVVESALAGETVSLIYAVPGENSGALLYTSSSNQLHAVAFDADEIRQIRHPFRRISRVIASPSMSIVLVMQAGTPNEPGKWYFLRLNEAVWDELPPGLQPLNVSNAGIILGLDYGNLNTNRLVYTNLESGTTQTLYQDKVHDIDRVIAGLRGAPIAARFLPGYPTWHYFEDNSRVARIHKSLIAAMPSSDVMVVSQSLDGQRLIVRVTNESRPPEYMLVNTKSGHVQRLLESQIGLSLLGGEGDTEYALQPFMIESRSGTAVFGFASIAINKANETRPMVIVLRDDFSESKWEWQFDEEVWFFNRQGFNVLLVNHSGTKGYGRLFAEKEPSRAVADIEDALSWALSNDLGGTAPLCVYGRYAGADIALELAWESGDVNCVIVISPSSDSLVGTSSSVAGVALTDRSLWSLAVFGIESDSSYKAAVAGLTERFGSPSTIHETLELPGSNMEIRNSMDELRILSKISAFLRRVSRQTEQYPVLPLNYEQAVEMTNVLESLSRRQNIVADSRTDGFRWLERVDGALRQTLFGNQREIYDEMSGYFQTISRAEEPEQTQRRGIWITDPERMMPKKDMSAVPR